MSQVLAELLGKPKEEVTKWVESMEAKTGYRGQDVRLLAAANLSLRKKTVSLGLDPNDTTAEELYHALVAKYGRDSALVNKALAVEEDASFEVRQDLAIGLVGHVVTDAQGWSLKNTALSVVLKNLQPKKLMKAWGYRSANSLLKREDASEIALAVKASEPAIWQKNFAATLKKIGQENYTLGPVRILKLAAARDFGSEPVLADGQLGVVALNPPKTKDLPVLSMTLLLIKALEKASLRLDAKPLAKINPALGFWRGAEHLLARAGATPVSFNVHDVSHSSDSAHNFGEHVFSHGAESLFNKLADSYEALSAELSDGAEQLEAEVKKSASPVQALALETVEI